MSEEGDRNDQPKCVENSTNKFIKLMTLQNDRQYINPYFCAL